MKSYHCVIIGPDGDILAEDVMSHLELNAAAKRNGLKHEFMTTFIARYDEGRVSNPAGVVMVWRQSHAGIISDRKSGATSIT